MDQYTERESLNPHPQQPHVYVSDDGRLYFSPKHPQSSYSSIPQPHVHTSVFPSEDLLNPEIYSLRKSRDRWAGWVKLGCSLLFVLGLLDLVFMILIEDEQEVPSLLLIVRTATDCLMVFTAWIGFRAANQLDSHSTRSFYKAMMLCGFLCVGGFCLMMFLNPYNGDMIHHTDSGRKLHESARYSSIYDYIRSSHHSNQKSTLNTDKQTDNQHNKVDCDEKICETEFTEGKKEDWDEIEEKYFTFLGQQIEFGNLDAYLSKEDKIAVFRVLEEAERKINKENEGGEQKNKWNWDWDDEDDEDEEEFEYTETPIETDSGGRGLQEYSSSSWDWDDEDDEDEEDFEYTETPIEKDSGGRGLQEYSSSSWDWDDEDDEDEEDFEYTETPVKTNSGGRGLQKKFAKELDIMKHDFLPKENKYQYDMDEKDEDSHDSGDFDDDQVYENAETFYMVVAFISIALVSLSFSLCCFCASRLYKSSVSYERLRTRPNSHLPNTGVPHVHPPYQAIPRNAPDLYPNLAPIGASVPSQ